MKHKQPIKLPLVGSVDVRTLLRWTEHFFAVIGLCFVLFHLGFESAVMTSGSMSPTLRGTSYENGDRFLLEKVTGWFRNPKRWEIYYYFDADGNPVTKRIVGMPGEKISIKDRTLLIDGKELERAEAVASIKYLPFGNLAAGREVDCGDKYFMLGDDTKDSLDSRYTGLVEKKSFRGRVWCVLWPGAHAGFVK